MTCRPLGHMRLAASSYSPLYRRPHPYACTRFFVTANDSNQHKESARSDDIGHHFSKPLWSPEHVLQIKIDR